jgi:hypothetical protein
MYLLKSNRYAKKGDEVTIYNKDHDPVWLVRRNGVQFPCHKDWLSDDKPEEEEEPTKIRKQPERRKAYTQAELIQLKYLKDNEKTF